MLRLLVMQTKVTYYSNLTFSLIILESPFIVNWRKTFLRKIREYKRQGRFIVYFDESYINAHHCPDRVMTDTTIKSAKDAEERGLTTGVYLANSLFSDNQIFRIPERSLYLVFGSAFAVILKNIQLE